MKSDLMCHVGEAKHKATTDYGLLVNADNKTWWSMQDSLSIRTRRNDPS